MHKDLYKELSDIPNFLGQEKLIPGFFLMPDSHYFQNGGFTCLNCNAHFCRFDHWKNHQTTFAHCRSSRFEFTMRQRAIAYSEEEIAVPGNLAGQLVKSKRLGRLFLNELTFFCH